MMSGCGLASSPLRGSSGSPEVRRGLGGPSPTPRPLAMPPLSPEALAALMAGGAPHALLDVRERGAYERGHIFRAMSLPRRLLEIRLPLLVSAHRTPLVLCDGDGRLAEWCLPALAEMGYTDVRVLAGGLAAGRAAGRPTVEGLNVPSKVFGERVLHERRTTQIAPRELQARIAEGADLVIDRKSVV